MIKKYIFSVVLNFSVVFFAAAQNAEETNRKFDSIYFHVATNLSGQDLSVHFWLQIRYTEHQIQHAIKSSR